MDIGPYIRKRRRTLGLSQETVGQLIGKSTATVCRMESGDVGVRIEDLPRIARALRCRPKDIMPPGWYRRPVPRVEKP